MVDEQRSITVEFFEDGSCASQSNRVGRFEWRILEPRAVNTCYLDDVAHAENVGNLEGVALAGEAELSGQVIAEFLW